MPNNHYPIVNNNGDTLNHLVESRREVLNHLRKAEEALRQIYPHGRNYQTVGDNGDRFQSARECHQNRLNVLHLLIVDIYGEAKLISRQR